MLQTVHIQAMIRLLWNKNMVANWGVSQDWRCPNFQRSETVAHLNLCPDSECTCLLDRLLWALLLDLMLRKTLRHTLVRWLSTTISHDTTCGQFSGPYAMEGFHGGGGIQGGVCLTTFLLHLLLLSSHYWRSIVPANCLRLAHLTHVMDPLQHFPARKENGISPTAETKWHPKGSWSICTDGSIRDSPGEQVFGGDWCLYLSRQEFGRLVMLAICNVYIIPIWKKSYQEKQLSGG